MASARILLVDDDETVRFTLSKVLEASAFEVVTASSVHEALHFIASETFDVLLTDLHMPDAGDGLTVVSAMRHSNPRAVTLVLSGFPEMADAAAAILLQADEILVKPLAVKSLINTIKQHLEREHAQPRSVESIASILEREMDSTIKDWLQRVELEKEITSVSLASQARTQHLPQLFRDLVFRLRYPQPLGSKALISAAAAEHGMARRQQGYSAAMMVDESRMLQVSIFQTLQNNLHKVDFSLLLVSVMAIADEVDSQLSQAMQSYISESKTDVLPIEA
jgi:YesN/AraC family two-component response regulator